MIQRYSWASGTTGTLAPTNQFGTAVAQNATMNIQGGKLRFAASSNSGGGFLWPTYGSGEGELRGRVTFSHNTSVKMLIQMGADAVTAEAYGGYFNAESFYFDVNGSTVSLRDTGPSLTLSVAVGFAFSALTSYDFVCRRINTQYSTVIWLTGTQRPGWIIDQKTTIPDSWNTPTNRYIGIAIDASAAGRYFEFDYLEYDDLRSTPRRF